MSKTGKEWPNIEHGRCISVSSLRGATLEVQEFVRLDLVTPMSKEAHDIFEGFLKKSSMLAALWLILWRMHKDLPPNEAMVLAAMCSDMTTMGTDAAAYTELLERLQLNTPAPSQKSDVDPEALPDVRIEVMHDHGKDYPGGRWVVREVSEEGFSGGRKADASKALQRVLESHEVTAEKATEIVDAVLPV